MLFSDIQWYLLYFCCGMSQCILANHILNVLHVTKTRVFADVTHFSYTNILLLLLYFEGNNGIFDPSNKLKLLQTAARGLFPPPISHFMSCSIKQDTGAGTMFPCFK